MSIRLDTVEIPLGQQRLEGTVLAPTTQFPGVLFVHGWGGCQEHDLSRAREVAGLGAVCLTFDLRGHERNAGQWETVNREQNLTDLCTAYDWLAAEPNVDPDAIDALVVEAENDEIVPRQVIENFVAAFRQPRSLTARKLSGADHGLTEKTHQNDYNAVLVKWLTEMIVGARAGDAASEVERHKQATSAQASA